MITDNPIKDAKMAAHERAGKPHIHCDVCGEPIYCATQTEYGEEYYNITGFSICASCIGSFKTECIA